MHIHIFVLCVIVCMWLHVSHIIDGSVCAQCDASKRGHVDLVSWSLSPSDLIHRCESVTGGWG